MSEPIEATVDCKRCGRPAAPALAKPPLRGPIGLEIQERVCADCWGEWHKSEVMVINELRLNFMDPASQDILTRHMREFLALDPPSAPDPLAGKVTPVGSTVPDAGPTVDPAEGPPAEPDPAGKPPAP